MEGRPAPDARDRNGVALFQQALRSAGYGLERMRVLLRSESDNLTPRPDEVPIVERLLPQRDRLADLLRLFLLLVDVPAGRAADALAPLPVERAERLGVVRRDGDIVRGAVRILPAAELLFTCDRELESDPNLPSDHVMAVSSSSIFLASLTIREKVADALDIGCGGGIQTLLAARHAKRVVACDVNPRALAYTAFNAALNDVSGIETRAGSFFEPVRGEKFGLIVSNPPFVVSPSTAIAFRDSGMRGDDVSRMVVREAAAHLLTGGHAFILVSWGIPLGADWADPLRTWVSDIGCDAWLLHQASATALGYASTWAEPLVRGAPGEFGRALDEWTRYYRELGYASIGYGAVILRKRTAAANWVRMDDLRGQREPASGEQVARLIAAEDFLTSHSDDQVLAQRFERESEHRLDQVLRARDGAFAVEGAMLSLETGLRFGTPIDAFTAELFASIDGTVTLAAAARSAAKRFDDGTVSESEFLDEAAASARRLLALGLIRLPAR